MAFMVVGLAASGGYRVYCQRQNVARAAGKHDETLLSDEGKNETHEARVNRARQLRLEHIRELRSQGLGGKIKAIYATLHEAPGGVYADVDEARRMKGDAWSGFSEYRLEAGCLTFPQNIAFELQQMRYSMICIVNYQR